jgi:hypothetical protein
MNLLSTLIAPVQAVVLFFAPHAGTVKPSGLRMPARAQSGAWPSSAPRASSFSVTSFGASSSSGSLGGFVHAGRTTYPRNRASVSAKPIHRVRVVRNVDTSLPADRAGRMVVSGRFADVCAELDKLASMEMRAA